MVIIIIIIIIIYLFWAGGDGDEISPFAYSTYSLEEHGPLCLPSFMTEDALAEAQAYIKHCNAASEGFE